MAAGIAMLVLALAALVMVIIAGFGAESDDRQEQTDDRTDDRISTP